MLTPIRVTQTYTLPDGTAPDPTAWVAFTPTAPLTDTSTEVDVSASTITAHLDSSGRLRDPHDAGVGVVLYANDDPTTTPTGTAYRVLEHLTRQADRTYYVVVPALAPGGTIALAALAPAGGVPPVVWGLVRLIGSAHTSVTTAAGVATLADAPTGVTAGTYTNADITVDASGHLSAASDGTGGGAVPVHLVSSGSTPSILAGSVLGPTPDSCTLTGTDTAGVIRVHTDEIGSGSGTTVVTVTFAAAYAAPPVVLLTPANDNAAVLFGFSQVYVADTVTTTQWTVKKAQAGGLGTDADYSWYYHVIG